MPDALLCQGFRTPIGRYGGALALVRPDDMLAQVMRAAVPDGVPVDEAIVGCANQAGEDSRNVARMSVLLAGLGEGVPAVTVNRLCGSGLDAVAMAARLVRGQEADVVLAGGVESMSRAPYVMPKPSVAYDRAPEVYDTTIGWRFVNSLIEQQYGIESMPETAENVAAEYSVSRADQDAFAERSHLRARLAQSNGRLAREIVPIYVPQKRGGTVAVETDEHPRQTNAAQLAALPTPFRDGGTVTAGNASGLNDGACALLVASPKAAAQYGLRPLARILGSATAGVDPSLMGIGPLPATSRLLSRLDLRVTDLDVVELNEAFASQSLAVLRGLGLPDDAAQVNPHGGAIALGHPLGMSGARLALSAALTLVKTGGRYGLCTMCVGVGQGIALALERV